MSNSQDTSDRAKDPGFWSELWEQARLVLFLMKDGNVPLYLKLLPFFAIVYVLSPIDLLPAAVAPVLGGMDDLTVLLVGAKIFIEMSPPDVVARYVRQMRGLGVMTVEGTSDKATAVAGEPHLLDQVVIDGEFEPWDNTAATDRETSQSA